MNYWYEDNTTKPVSKFTYKNISKDQKLFDFENLNFIWKSNITSIY